VTQRCAALLTRARDAYIVDMKHGVIKGKSGVDFAALFDA